MSRPRRRRLIGTAVLLGLLLAVTVAALAWVSPLLGVRSVTVEGTVLTTPDAVLSAAAVTTGTPLPRLDTAGVIQRVSALPPVGAVTVQRRWPHQVHLVVTERQPAAVVPLADAYRVFDAAGVEYARLPGTPPAGLPVLDLGRDGASDSTIQQMLLAYRALPPQIAATVTSLLPVSDQDLRMRVTPGAEIRWGSAERSADKAAVLAVLLTRPATVYDVSAPDAPATR